MLSYLSFMLAAWANMKENELTFDETMNNATDLG